MGRVFLVLLALTALLVMGLMGITALAGRSFGPPAASLTVPQVLQYSAKLLWANGLLTKPLQTTAPQVDFEIEAGESVASLCGRLQRAGIVRDASMMRDYLIYTGQDTSLQAGRYRVSAAMSIVDIARSMQDATPTQVEFVVLPGWRIEEIGASLPTSGLAIQPDEFVASASAPRTGFDFLAGARTTEGFLYPDSYVLAGTTTSDQLIEALLRNFSLHVGADLREGFAKHGLSVYEGTTLASIVQREAVREQEAPMIASVYLNRLLAAMRLDADPTVQYALGFNPEQHTWWTNPLSLDDLRWPSAYNTYLHAGLPPAPIANPGPGALRAVAAPTDSPYYFFSALCDGSGYHAFAATFEEHLGNLCP